MKIDTQSPSQPPGEHSCFGCSSLGGIIRRFHALTRSSYVATLAATATTAGCTCCQPMSSTPRCPYTQELMLTTTSCHLQPPRFFCWIRHGGSKIGGMIGRGRRAHQGSVAGNAIQHALSTSGRRVMEKH